MSMIENRNLENKTIEKLIDVNLKLISQILTKTWNKINA